MFCSNCGNKIEDGSKFCPECGKSLTSEPQASAEPEEKVIKTKTKKEKKPVNKKAVKLISLISGGIVLLLVIFYTIPSLFIPLVKMNKAKSLSKEGNHMEAYEMADSISSNLLAAQIYNKRHEYAQKAFDALIEQEKYREAYDFALDFDNSWLLYNGETKKDLLIKAIEDHIKNYEVAEAIQIYYDNLIELEDYFSTNTLDQVEESERENVYNAVTKVLNTKNLWEIMDEEYNPIRARASVRILSYMLSSIPNDYQNAGKLKMFCDGIANNFGDDEYKYIYENTYSLIISLWDLASVRSLVMKDSNIEAYFNGTWKNIVTNEYLSFETSPYLYGENLYETNLSTPDVVFRYYAIDNMTLIYCNEGRSKVCDVFKFEFDPTTPFTLKVYCYEDGKTVTLVRMLTD